MLRYIAVISTSNGRTTVPIGCFWAGVVSSNASSITRLRKRSYPRRIPLTLRPPWRWMNNFLSMNCKCVTRQQHVNREVIKQGEQHYFTFLSSGCEAFDMFITQRYSFDTHNGESRSRLSPAYNGATWKARGGYLQTIPSLEVAYKSGKQSRTHSYVNYSIRWTSGTFYTSEHLDFLLRIRQIVCYHSFCFKPIGFFSATTASQDPITLFSGSTPILN